jgi:5-methyltetrahydropteroyltriglutamate--homocysteine methyltransferase
MATSADRILTTHTGSLPRPPALRSAMERSQMGELAESERAELPELIANSVREIVAKQIEVGVDIVSDGEAGKPGYATYITQRLSGFGATGPLPVIPDAREFPEWGAALGLDVSAIAVSAACNGEIAYVDRGGLETDLANFTRAMQGQNPAGTFMTAASPGVIAMFMENQHYDSHESYIWALADAMKTEYDAIHEAGLVLQLDCPDLAAGRCATDDALNMSSEQWLRQAEMHVEAINHATRDVAPEAMRLHICWGNYEGPHTRDIALADIVEVVLRARPRALLFEAANPRHEHEWRVFEDVDLPEGKILVPGVLDSTTNYVEHPELVAERLVRLANVVGRENVIAGTDCGFATFVGHILVEPEVTWAKLRALSDGAKIASRRLWG